MSSRLSHCLPLILALVCCAAATASWGDNDGARLFQDKCASCHGAHGEGVAAEYANPLTGDRSLKELSQYIDDKMPPGEPEAIDAAGAAKVAGYIYDAFYSPTAQFRNKPARIELSRLTVRQYRHAVAAIIDSFAGRGDWNDERGLKAEYFTSPRPRENKQVLERTDPLVDFHYEDKTPDGEKITNTEQFSARWEGSVIVPEDGEYEFIVETENGMRLWVNDPRTPLIDVAVRSGDQKEYRASILLLGGRAYQLQLDFMKSKPEKTASVVLKWARPGHTPEVIPNRSLWPQQSPERLIVTTPFPPDDRSMGYDRGTSISKEWDEATTYAALEAANWVTTRRHQLIGADPNGADRIDKLKILGQRFLERAFRRPLSEEQKQNLVEKQFAESPDDETAIKRIVLIALKSPEFLYQDLNAQPGDAFTIASRLSFALWDSIPDEPLAQAAANGELKTREQAQSQVDRMLADHRTQAKLMEFFKQWLRLDRFGDLAKDAAAYPDFTPEIVSDLRTSLEMFLEDVIGSEASDFRRLLTSDEMYVNGRLAKFYGIDLPEDAPFQKVNVSKDHRVGILCHPYLLAGFAYHSTSSPIHRGVFISRSLLGRALRPPPVAVAPLAPDLEPSLTTRERVLLQTSPDQCMSCHGMINPLGFSLEHFDAVGRYREQEKEKPVDSAGAYIARSGDTVGFGDIHELAQFLATGPEATEAFVQQLFHFAVKQPIRAYGDGRIEELRNRFVEQGANIRKLLGDIAITAAMDAPASQPAQALSKQESAHVDPSVIP
jgi:hypothetical protein